MKKTKQFEPLDEETRETLRVYMERQQIRYGEDVDWKAKLTAAWMTGSEPGLLHRLRNTHGPAWLASFEFPAPFVEGTMLETGKSYVTASGRMTAPVPKLGKSVANNLRKTREWLLDEGIAEARAKGDEFVLAQFENEDPKKLPTATVEALNTYLAQETA